MTEPLFTFKYVDSDGCTIIKETKDTTSPEILSGFMAFLLACGYCFTLEQLKDNNLA